MNFFKKIFGNSSNKADNKPDMDALLSSADTNNSIIELDNYICKLSSWSDTLEQLTEPQKNFYINQNLEREVNNGGFNLFFFNSSGNFAHETITSLQAIGAYKTADILQQAIDQFPGSKVPKDRAERQEVLEKIEGKANEILELLDQRFFVYEDDLNELNIEYVRQNRSLF